MPPDDPVVCGDGVAAFNSLSTVFSSELLLYSTLFLLDAHSEFGFQILPRDVMIFFLIFWGVRAPIIKALHLHSAARAACHLQEERHVGSTHKL